MTATHGSKAVLKINSVDISASTDSSSLERSRDVSDVTCYGDTAHRIIAGLKNGKLDFGGNESKATIDSLVTAFEAGSVTFEYAPEGTATGASKESGSVIITSLSQASPVADKNTWTASAQVDGAITRGAY